jgi:isoquinoline 1-oxidoreductase alpha subunit
MYLIVSPGSVLGGEPGVNDRPPAAASDMHQEDGDMATLNVNGKVRNFDVEPETPLLWALREQLGLTGTKYGCGVAQCGACTVLIDGVAIRSCVRPVATVKANQKIVTIEGLSPKGSHPVQKAWVALDVPQCGFCQSGMIMAATALLAAKPNPTDADIDESMTNICRCGTYNRVRAAIKAAAKGGDVKRAGLSIQHADGSIT